MEKDTIIKAYKGFNNDLTCLGFQYEIGKEYETDRAELCNSGFHACTDALDVLQYYFMDYNAEIARFCKVEQFGDIDKSNQDTKTASTKIKVLKEIQFPELLEDGIQQIEDKIFNSPKFSDTEDKPFKTNNEHRKFIGIKTDYSSIANSGCEVHIAHSGTYGRTASCGNHATLTASGNYASIVSSGYGANIYEVGKFEANIASTGIETQIGSLGSYAYIASTGYCTKIISVGKCAHIVDAGESGKIFSSGDNALISANGHYSIVTSKGKNATICCTGMLSEVKAKKGSWITLAEYGYHPGERVMRPICVKTEQVDGVRIKEDVFYRLVNGEFEEVVK